MVDTAKIAPLAAQLQATLDKIPAYTWYANPTGGLTFVNTRSADYLGLPSDHPLRLGIDTGAAWDSHIALLHPEDAAETRRVWSNCLKTGSAGEVSFRLRNADGAYRWFLSRAEPLRAQDGTILYWIGINLDIEDRKRAEIELQRCLTSRRSSSSYWDPNKSACTPIVRRSRTSAARSRSGGSARPDRKPTRTMSNGAELLEHRRSSAARRTRWRSGCAPSTGAIAGFWHATTRCATPRDRSCAGTWPLPISTIASASRTGCATRRSRCAKTWTAPRCSRRSWAHPPRCNASWHRWRRWHRRPRRG